MHQRVPAAGILTLREDDPQDVEPPISWGRVEVVDEWDRAGKRGQIRGGIGHLLSPFVRGAGLDVKRPPSGVW